jgi:hypothetical protein
VRDLPGAIQARDVYAVARASSVRRPSVAVILAALDTAAGRLGRLAPAATPAGLIRPVPYRVGAR